MAHDTEYNAIHHAMELILENGLGGLDQAVSILINEAMKVERSQALNAAPWERTGERKGYANGYKDKHLKSRLGLLDLKIPQVRGDVSFYPKALERGTRSERALTVAIAEMYVQGVSTRKVTAVLEKLCGLEVSSSQVSSAAALLDEELEKWRTRKLGKTPFVQVDARYEKVRRDGAVKNCAALVATGVLDDGHRSILGVSVAISEAEVHWRDFLLSLQERGLHGVKMVTSDDHAGLRAALNAVFPGVLSQRCQVHLQRNAASQCSRVSLRKEAARTIRDIFNAPDRNEAQRLLDRAVKDYANRSEKLANWMEKNIPEGFAVFALPDHQRKRLRSTNMVERLNKEILRRTRVATIFPNEASLLRLVSAVLIEKSEEWETGRIYLRMDEG
ncbi:MAG: IS256 family transposase [Deltaproteobacteria bacterium]|nr:IS256 family transposase [Deltaproteobacteria bacterium]